MESNSSGKGQSRSSSILVVVLVFAVLFSMLYASNIIMQIQSNTIPTKPRISQLQVIQIVEHDLQDRYDLTNSSAIRMYFSMYNFTDYGGYTFVACKDKCPESYYASFADAKANPKLLTIPLYYIHPNGTEYFISTIRNDPKNGTPRFMCSHPDIHCIGDPEAVKAVTGKLVYRLELLRPFTGYYYVDANTGEILYRVNFNSMVRTDNQILTQPKISQEQAIDTAIKDIQANYVKNTDFFKMLNYSSHIGPDYISLQEWMAEHRQLPLVYYDPNGTALGIDVKTQQLSKCGLLANHSIIICIEPDKRNLLYVEGHLTWIVDMDAGCMDPSEKRYPFFYVIDAMGEGILWKGGSPPSQIQSCIQ